MILNLNKNQGQKSTQNNLLSSQNFLQNNKISINEVHQAHYTVEGVQMYGAQQIKALKHNQDRLKRQEGIAVQIKLYQISDDIDVQNQFNKDQDSLRKTKTGFGKVQNKSVLNQNKSYLKNPQHKQEKKLSAKQRMEKNNNALTRLQKQRNKKSLIEKKLQKLSKHYKQHFKGREENQKQGQQNEQEIEQNEQKSSYGNNSSLCQSIKKITKSQNYQSQNGDSDNQDEDQEQKNNKKKPQNKSNHGKVNQKDRISFKKKINKTDLVQIGSTKVASTKASSILNNMKQKNKSHQQIQKPHLKKNNFMKDFNQQNDISKTQKNHVKHQRNIEKIEKKGKKISCSHSNNERVSQEYQKSQGSDCQFQEVDYHQQGINLVGKIFQNKSTYSQKLGSAVHLLFK